MGRVAECGETHAYVCYGQGCTAAKTAVKNLRAAYDREIATEEGHIGYHRFDEYCPARDDDACHMCKAKKG